MISYVPGFRSAGRLICIVRLLCLPTSGLSCFVDIICSSCMSISSWLRSTCSILSALLVSSTKKDIVSPGYASVFSGVAVRLISFGSGVNSHTAPMIISAKSISEIAPIISNFNVRDIFCLGAFAYVRAWFISAGEYPEFMSVVLIAPGVYPAFRSLFMYSVKLCCTIFLLKR